MSAQYDSIGAAYVNWKETPIPKYSEVPTLRRLLKGRIEGRDLLDLACGTGFYARLFRQWGAARIVGVDISAAMIAEAQAIEDRQRAGLTYLRADVASLPRLGAFDLAAAMYLLHYAETAEVMRAKCRAIAANLKPGGELVALLPEPDYVMGKGDTLRYGFSYRQVAEGDGWRLVHADVHTEPPFSIEYRHWSRDIYAEALAQAGFGGLTWQAFEVSAEGMERFGAAYWQDILANPVSTVLMARLSPPS